MSYIKYICCFCIALVLCTAGQHSYAAQGISQSEYTLFSAAKRAIEAKEYTSIVPSFDKYFRQKGTKHVYGYEIYGIILLNMKEYQRAVQILAQGFKAYPQSAVLAQNLGMAYYHTKQTLKAAQSFESAYTLTQRKNPALAYTAGHFYVLSKQYKNAITLLQPIVNTSNAKALWFQVLAQAYMDSGQGKQAIATLEKGLSIFKENASLWRMLGYVYYKAKKTKEAAAAYEIAYKFSPASATEIKQLASLYYSLYAPFSGKNILSFTNTSPEVLDHVSVLLAQSGDFATAIEVTQLALKKKYSDSRQFRLGQILRRKKSFSQAQKIFSALAKKNGAYAERAQWMIAEMAWEKKDWKNLVLHLQALQDKNGSLAAMASQLLETVNQLAEQELTAYSTKEKQ